jgi:hypothetical protein
MAVNLGFLDPTQDIKYRSVTVILWNPENRFWMPGLHLLQQTWMPWCGTTNIYHVYTNSKPNYIKGNTVVGKAGRIAVSIVSCEKSFLYPTCESENYEYRPFYY